MQPFCKDIRLFAAGCEQLISREPPTVLADGEYGYLTFYIAELQAILKVRRTRENALVLSLNKVSPLHND